MTDPKEIPQLVTELVNMSKEYLRQETLEPAKRLGRYSGFSLLAAALYSVAAVLFTLGFYSVMRRLLPDTQWWGVAAKLFTAVGAGSGAGMIVWRMSSNGDSR
ncbi:MAG: hypothetical protein Q8Q52_02375 [Acidimicrobiia bacterium]|nr:hypothetical protein [Acidimicrobiia bacterium]